MLRAKSDGRETTMRSKRFLMALFGLLIGSTFSRMGIAESRMIVNYPGTDVIVSVPGTWLNLSKDRLSIFSPDRKLEVAGTAYEHDSGSLDDFSETKYLSIKEKMPWYKRLAAPRSVTYDRWSGNVVEFVGTWPNETEPTHYFVVTGRQNHIYFSLTFTVLEKDLPNYKNQIEGIFQSVRIK